jgi:hypothetical protein
MFNFFASKYLKKIEELESKIDRLNVTIEMLKTEIALIPVRRTLEKLEEERQPCCDSGCTSTPNCPSRGSVCW